MKRILLIITSVLFFATTNAQITITATDMPVSGDTLRLTTAATAGAGINLADSGASSTWNYSSLVPRAQTVDTYQTALSVSLTYLLISINAYGYKVADSFPGGSFLPVSITQLYTFFEKQSSNTRFAAVAFAAKIAGLATPFNYSKDDIWYYFPLNYGNVDSSNYALNITLTSAASIKQIGYRKTKVDGWGTITTPFYTTPVNCIRVRSEIHGVDSINFGFPLGIPRNSVEYKWLVHGDHYPALWVTTNVTGTTETITSIRYRDNYQNLSLSASSPLATRIYDVKAFPNPSANGIFQLDIPAQWKEFSVEVFDVTGKLLTTTYNKPGVDLHSFAAGQYVARVTCGAEFSYVKLLTE